MNNNLAILPGSLLDLTQPTNSNPTSGKFSLGTVSDWLGAATQGAGTVLGALNNRTSSTSSGAAAPASNSVPIWVWIAGGGVMLLLLVFLLLTPKK
ncbi:MAG: hypothetical protein KGL39_26015 [Patescibacteria group bacterium]|nr:hypothetical protein [Patescibacteria group bacterium]